MASNISFNGVTYSIPAVGDDGWGSDLSAYFIAIASGALQKTGGTFTLTAEANFGATFGLKSAYVKSQAANPASAGILRLGNNESLSWRNAANNADLNLTVNASNALQYNGSTLLYSAAASIVNADISPSAAIAYSKLNLALSILNSDISASAAIALSKLAALTVSRALQSNASTGAIEVSSVTNTELGYLSGVTSAIQTQLGAKVAKSTLTTKGDIYVATGASNVVRQAIGTDGQVLTADSAQTNGLIWATPSSSPTASYEISNLGLATSVAANALTIALKQADGSTNPSTGASAVKVGMRSSTLTSGLYNQRSVTSALSLVVSSGSTLGQASALAARLYIYLIDNAGTLELAVSQKLFPETQLISTTAEGGAGAADSGTVMYSTTARSNVPFRLVGFLDNTQTTAGTWTSAGTKLQVGNFGSLTSEQVIFVAEGATSSAVGTNTDIPFNTVVEDTHSGWSVGNKDWTVPISGYYEATFASKVSGIGASLNQYADFSIQIDTVSKRNFVQYLQYASVIGVHGLVQWQGYLNAGQKINATVDTNITSPILSTSAAYTYMHIKRIK